MSSISSLEAQLAAVEAEISRHEQLKSNLQSYQTQLNTSDTSFQTDVIANVSGYDLLGESDWVGTNADTATEQKGTLDTDINNYEDAIANLKNEISTAISTVEGWLNDEYAEKSQIEAAIEAEKARERAAAAAAAARAAAASAK